ncbi:MAG TPA: ORF6N domain-containing protein [Gammaproteobacteria bacterium]|nr:ORF6N domain-containing protein [Gammaproteobacteria bacterium]
MTKTIIPADRIEHHILFIRDHKVLLDTDLAALYGVTTKRLNEQVKRNQDRFPADFMFQLTTAEKQEVVANCDHLKNLKFSPKNPYAFTEHGTIMVASVLSTPHAIAVSLLVVRTFVKLRQMLVTNKELSYKFAELERRLKNHDETIRTLISAIQELMEPPQSKQKHPIGFAAWPTD